MLLRRSFIIAFLLSAAVVMLGCALLVQQASSAAANFQPLANSALSTAASVYPQAPTPHRVQPTGLWGSTVSRGAHPTNDWWFNLIFGSGSSPLKTYPYLMRCDNNGLTIGYPGSTVQPNYVSDAFVANMAFGATQTLGQRQLTGFGKLYATVRYGTAGSASLTIPFVRGQAYVSALYWNLTPKITSAHAIININGQGSQPGRSASGTKFKIGLNNGQTWLLYAEKSITLSQTVGNVLQATAPFTGYLRLAILPSASAESMFDNYADSIPMNGTVRYEFASLGSPRSGNNEVFDQAHVIFEFKKYGNQQKPLLMYALPHHQDSLVSPLYPTTRINIQTIKGTMTAVAGDKWTLLENLTNTGFYAKYEPSQSDVNALKAALAGDKNKRPVAQDPYFGGKQMASMGRLALIADQLGDTATATSIRNNMKQSIDLWLSPSGANAFMFERTWGGVVSKASTGWDPAAEFGMGYYNDHHFHFGYFVYSAAVLGLKDSTWLAANKAKIIDLIRDYASPVSDGVFPEMRMKDPFVGHSFAAGLYEFADIKNQESTSESINSYYAISLFGRTIGDANMFNWGRLLLATEIRSAMKYWHMPSSSNIYPLPFKNNKMAGIVWETKVDYATFFGASVEFIHGIQMMPFTPITEEYLPADFIREEYPVLATSLTRGNPVIPDGWKGFVFMAHAIIDKTTARREIDTLNGYDDGNSKTNTIYWVSSRPVSGATRVWESFTPRH